MKSTKVNIRYKDTMSVDIPPEHVIVYKLGKEIFIYLNAKNETYFKLSTNKIYYLTIEYINRIVDNLKAEVYKVKFLKITTDLNTGNIVFIFITTTDNQNDTADVVVEDDEPHIKMFVEDIAGLKYLSPIEIRGLFTLWSNVLFLNLHMQEVNKKKNKIKESE